MAISKNTIISNCFRTLPIFIYYIIFSLFLALFLSSSMAFFIFSKRLYKKWINRIVFILEAVPDMMMMICLQIFSYGYFRNLENLLSLLFPLMKIELIYSYFIISCLTYITNVSDDGVIHKRRARKTLRRGCIWKRPFIKLYTMHSFIQKYIYPLLPPFKTIFVFLLSNLFILEFVLIWKALFNFYLIRRLFHLQLHLSYLL